MPELIIYFIKVNITVSLLFTVYWLLFRNEKFFNLNRFILLSIITFAFVLPLLPYSSFTGTQNKVVNGIQERLAEVELLQNLTTSEKQRPSKENHVNIIGDEQQKNSPNFSLFQFVVAIYLLIVSILFARLIFQLVQLSSLLKGNETKIVDGIVYHTTEKPLPPFSFFQHLVISKSQSETNQIEQIIAHEKVHIRQWHILDILLGELMQMLFWVNPLVWMLNSSVKLNLEYIADEKVLNSGVDRKRYQVNILTSCLNTTEYTLANLFNSSKIKLRIKMMNAKDSPLSHLYRYALILPVAMATFFIINPVNSQTSSSGYKKIADKSSHDSNGIETASVSPSNKMQEEGFQEKDKIDKLIRAIEEENETLLKGLLQDGVNINGVGSEGRTPLSFSINKGKARFVRLLLDAKADVNYRLIQNGTPLILAVRGGNLEIVRLLLERGADINRSSQGDGNPLIMACMYGHAQIAAFLVEQGADVNAVVEGDETPLINAARRGNLNIVENLVSNGANVNLTVIANPITQPELRSPLNQAIQYKHSAVEAYLRDKGAKQ